MEKFTFFWSGVFSQWHMCPIIIDHIMYNCTEQYMMAQKALLFKDLETHKKIMSAITPDDQKRYGREVKNFDIPIWQKHAVSIVYKANYAKYTQNEDLKKALLATSGTTLVEASPYDKIWGIGLKASDPKAKDRKTWRGSNWLGEILTKVREDILRKEI